MDIVCGKDRTLETTVGFNGVTIKKAVNIIYKFWCYRILLAAKLLKASKVAKGKSHIFNLFFIKVITFFGVAFLGEWRYYPLK